MNTPAVHKSAPSMAEIIERYRKLYTGAVYDILDEMDLPNQALASDLRPMRPEMIVAGPAFTLQGVSDTIADPVMRERRIQMFNQMSFPCVDVRDCGFDTRVAHYGEMTATLARSKGCVGAVVDGGVRDTGHLLRMDFPVFHRYYTPIEAKKRWAYYRWQVPVQIRGQMSAVVVVNPGDFVFGDMDGVLIIPQERIVEVLRLTEEMSETENQARAEFSAPGADAEAVYKKYGRL